MKHPLFLLVFSFYLLISPLSAQITHTATGTVDETANSIIKKASDKMATGAFSVPVTVVNYDANKKETFRQKADITYKSPCYKVIAGDIEIWCDGESVWQVNRNTKEVVVTNMTKDDDDITNPAALLANYKKNYRAKFIREEGGTAIIDLQPKKSRTFHKLRLFIETSSGRLKKIEQHNYDSSRGEFTFGKYASKKLTSTDFKFSAPQGFEVVDMR